MRTGTLLALLIPALALGADPIPTDAPRLVHVKSGTAVIVGDDGAEVSAELPPGAFLNEPGMTKLGKAVEGLQTDNADLRAQNDFLRKAVDEQASSTAVPLKTVLLVGAGALVAGAAVGAGAVILFKK